MDASSLKLCKGLPILHISVTVVDGTVIQQSSIGQVRTHVLIDRCCEWGLNHFEKRLFLVYHLCLSVELSRDPKLLQRAPLYK